MKKILMVLMCIAFVSMAYAETETITPTTTPTATASNTPTQTETTTPTNTPLPTATVSLSASDIGNGEWALQYNGMQAGSDITLYIYGADSRTVGAKNNASTQFSTNVKLPTGDYSAVAIVSYVDRDGDGQSEGDTKSNTSNVVSFYSKAPRMSLLRNMPKISGEGELIMKDKLEQDIREGSRYSVAYPDTDIDDTNTTYFILVPNGNIPITINSSLTDGYFIRLYEGGAVIGGTTLTAYNDNRSSSLSSSTLVYFADTGVNTAGATAIREWYEGTEDSFDRTLDDGITYILGLVSDTADQSGSVELKWEE